MNRVLIITYYWPPAGGPGVQRVVKFVKYLPQFGWHPTVLTVRSGEYQAIDESLERDITQDVRVIRTSTLEPFSMYKKFTGRSTDESIPAGFVGDSSKKSLTEKLARAVRMNLFLPDARIGWKPFAEKAAKQLIGSEKPDIILTSSPPQTVQLIGGSIKKILHVPWIADFRDPWTDIYYYEQSERSAWADYIDRRMEKNVLRQVDCISSVSREIVDLLQSKVKHTIDSMVLPNGYDPEDFAQATSVDRNKFKISHIGKLSETQPIDSMVDAIVQAMEVNPDLRNDLSIRFIGSLAAPQKSVMQTQLVDRIAFEDYKPHSEVVGDMQQAALLFLIIPQTERNEGILTGKLFEYIGAKRPILAIGPKNGAAARVIQDLESAKMFDYEETDFMCDWILDIYRRWKNGESLYVNAEHANSYSRIVQVQQLAKKMRELLKSPKEVA